MRVILLAALLACMPAIARAEDPQLVELLSGIEWVPGAQDLSSRGIGSADLMALYGDEDVPVFVQVRAVELLVHYPEPAVRTLLEAVARVRQQHPAFLRVVASSLVPHGNVAVRLLARLSCHRDRSVREAAVRALGEVRTPAAHEQLRRRRRVERDRTVLSAIDAALASAPAQ